MHWKRSVCDVGVGGHGRGKKREVWRVICDERCIEWQWPTAMLDWAGETRKNVGRAEARAEKGVTRGKQACDHDQTKEHDEAGQGER